MKKRAACAALVAALALPFAGCGERTLKEVGVLGFLMKVLAGDVTPDKGAKAWKATPYEETLDVQIDAEVGGLSGEYAVTLSEVEGGTFGTFSGTGVIKKGRFVTIKDNGTEGLKATVAAIASRVLDQDVTILKAKAKVTANQEPGAVAANWKATVKFSGTVDSGPQAGGKIKGGKITQEGSHTFD
ncbi:MAG: hypothetical protein HUU06_05105 [Planctomycetaceae bacterium]|nr:hypothetical protein [Planctomycetota bacterium]NUN52151.1 hypothetical protein [Planctomycetaceae bacterium]